MLIGMVPNNVVTAAADNDILAVMFFALFFGIGLVLPSSAATDALQATRSRACSKWR